MSETVHCTGTLEKLELAGTWNEKIKKLESRGIVFGEWNDEDDQCLDTEEVVIINDEWYRVVDKTNKPNEDDVFVATEVSGKIEFTVKYYNGGCSFDEALGFALEKMENK